MSAKLEYTLENKQYIYLNDKNEIVSEISRNDFPFLNCTLVVEDGELLHHLTDGTFIKKKIGLKVALMKIGIVFREIILSNTFGLTTAIIYNDYLNIFYSAVNYDEETALYNAYNKAINDFLQFRLCGYSFNSFIKEKNQALLEITEKTSNNTKLDYIFNKFCQDVERGLLNQKLEVCSLLDEEISKSLDCAKSDNFIFKFYKVVTPIKKNPYEIVYGQLYNKNNRLISESVCFDIDLSEALCKTYIKLVDNVVYTCGLNSDIDWTAHINEREVFEAFDLNVCKNEIKPKVKYDVSDYLIKSEDSTKSLIDFYNVDKVLIKQTSVYVASIFIVETGVQDTCEEKNLTDRIKKLLIEKDFYLIKLLENSIKKINIGDA